MLRRGARTSAFMHARAVPAGSRRAVAQTLAFTESLRLFVLSRDARRAQADEGNRPNNRRGKQDAIN